MRALPARRALVGFPDKRRQLKELEKLGPKLKGIARIAKNELAAAQEETATLESKISALRVEIENEANVRQDNPTRRTSLTLLQAKRDMLATSKAELAQHGLADPALLEQKRRAIVLAREAASRHTGEQLSDLAL
ncbi:hypothetical protein FRC10_005560 [Ceratobasidium sp. 414]|nr:hypothetical protein FRC10_005560 [Ceratobasidium sp. 414]